MQIPRNKLACVKGIRAALFSREAVAAHFKVGIDEVRAWERAYAISEEKGWGHIKALELEPQ